MITLSLLEPCALSCMLTVMVIGKIGMDEKVKSFIKRVNFNFLNIDN